MFIIKSILCYISIIRNNYSFNLLTKYKNREIIKNKVYFNAKLRHSNILMHLKWKCISSSAIYFIIV